MESVKKGRDLGCVAFRWLIPAYFIFASSLMFFALGCKREEVKKEAKPQPVEKTLVMYRIPENVASLEKKEGILTARIITGRMIGENTKAGGGKGAPLRLKSSDVVGATPDFSTELTFGTDSKGNTWAFAYVPPADGKWLFELKIFSEGLTVLRSISRVSVDRFTRTVDITKWSFAVFPDHDGDKFPSVEEKLRGADPLDPQDCPTELTWKIDKDGDGYWGEEVSSCVRPENAVLFDSGMDCDDTNPDINPSAAEIKDGVDNDCDGIVDNVKVSLQVAVSTCPVSTFYRDQDGDGYGDPAIFIERCPPAPSGYVELGGDCNDARADINPGADEICADGVDNDCDGVVDEASCIAGGGAGGEADVGGGDVGDGVATVCDQDGDGFQAVGDTCGGNDCDDTNPDINPGASEMCGDNIDNDCDGKVDEGVSEVCDGIDNDCDGIIDEGFDQDGDGYTSCGGDCDDTDTNINPGEIETCDAKDNDCDGQIDEGEVCVSVNCPGLSPAQNWISVGGLYHSCGIDNGRVLCWGRNSEGQVGVGSFSWVVTQPTYVSAITDVAKVFTSGYHTCAVIWNSSSPGHVFCWGKNSVGQVGASFPYQVSEPAQVSSIYCAIDIAGGENFSCAVTSGGDVFCWGYNSWGVLGQDHLELSSSYPLRIPISDVVSISVGSNHVCALKKYGTVWCWGRNTEGQLGNSTVTSSPVTTPVQVDFPSGTSITQISANCNHTCAVDTNHDLWCWGDNSSMQIGDIGTYGATVSSPVKVTSSVQWVSAGCYHTCMVDLSGDLYCWGRNREYELGDGTNVSSPYPLLISSGISRVFAGVERTCATDTLGRWLCWGGNIRSRVGIPSDKPYPVLIMSGIQEVSAGTSHTCAIRGNNLLCWGWNVYYQLGLGDTDLREIPTQVTSISARDVSAGIAHTCAIDTKSDVWCWGADIGQVGTGGAPFNSKSVTMPAKLTGDLQGGIDLISSGGGFTCAIEGKNRRGPKNLYCWGLNYYGQISATVPPIELNYPTFITSGVIFISAGSGVGYSPLDLPGHVCTIDTNDDLYCAGDNSFGQLGYGDKNQRPLDFASPVSPNIADVSAGEKHTCAVDTNGNLMCWGDNFSGQLGLGYFGGEVSSPAFVMSRITDVEVSREYRFFLSYQFSCALDENDDLWCWGELPFHTFSTSTPQKVASGVRKFSAGGTHLCYIDTSGNDNLWCMGDNTYGQIGDGTRFIETPTQIR